MPVDGRFIGSGLIMWFFQPPSSPHPQRLLVAVCMQTTGRNADVQSGLALAVRLRQCVFHLLSYIVPPSNSSLKSCAVEWVHPAALGGWRWYTGSPRSAPSLRSPQLVHPPPPLLNAPPPHYPLPQAANQEELEMGSVSGSRQRSADPEAVGNGHDSDADTVALTESMNVHEPPSPTHVPAQPWAPRPPRPPHLRTSSAAVCADTEASSLRSAPDPLVMLRSGLDCCICLEPYKDEVLAPCTHSFCSACITAVLRVTPPYNRGACPICRKEVCTPCSSVAKPPAPGTLIIAQGVGLVAARNPPLGRQLQCWGGASWNKQNHAEERLLDQAQARASHTPPPSWGRLRSIPQDMGSDV